jgi:hypothetical protein
VPCRGELDRAYPLRFPERSQGSRTGEIRTPDPRITNAQVQALRCPLWVAAVLVVSAPPGIGLDLH